jgi:ribonuclease BN (tRNA processing enzyme)
LKLTFLGTRWEIKVRSRAYRRHSALPVRYSGTAIMIDCGADWLHRLSAVAPTRILITHAHQDHAWELAGAAFCPVYAANDAWAAISA